MPVVNELIRSEEDGTISFGNYKLDVKSKLPDFEHCGDTYKVKTFYEITKLEKNGSQGLVDRRVKGLESRPDLTEIEQL